MRPVVVDWLASFLPRSLAEIIAPGWFACVGLAGIVTLFWMMRRARRAGLDPVVIATAVLWCYATAVAAGIAVPMLLDAIEQQATTGHATLRWAGMTSFWGYLAGAGAVIGVCRDHRVPLARMADLSTAPLGVALALARVGCFLGGCDYGKVTSLPWAVRFPAGSPAWADHVAAGLVPADRGASLPVHPTELYEALLGLAITAMAFVVARRARRPGAIFIAGVVMYSLGRIAIETLRGDAGRGIYAGLSSGQIFSLLVLATLVVAWRARRVAAIASAAVALLAVRADAQPAPPPPPPPTSVQSTTNDVPITLDVAGLVGVAAPLNRRPDQVPGLLGWSLSVGVVRAPLAAWLDFDSMANSEARHGTLLVSAGVLAPVGDRSWLGARAGVGGTLVNFYDPVFQDVSGTTMRVETLAAYALTPNWQLWARPFAIDVLSAANLGGPIVTFQSRIGIAYRFGFGGAPRAAQIAKVP